MILIFKRGVEYKGTIGNKNIDAEGSTFPLISLPVNEEGSPTELNDFQWWAYTDQWNQWLKKNPREWTAESQESPVDKAEKIWEEIFNQPNPYAQFFNFQVTSILEKGKLSTFDQFAKMYESEDADASGITKKFIKLGYAIESLAKAGTLKANLSLDDIREGEKIAIVVDFRDESGSPIPESRQALRFSKIKDTSKLTLGLVDYSIPIGEIKDDTGSLLKKVGEYAKVVLVGGVAVGSLLLAGRAAGGAVGLWALKKAVRGVYPNFLKSKSINQVVKSPGMWSKVKTFGASIFGRGSASGVANAAKVVLPSGAYVEGGLAYNAAGTALKGAASNSVKGAATRAVASGATRAGAGGVVAAEASNPVGWIIAAATAIASTGQQLYNWLSDKQAPRFSDVDDFAKGEFKPAQIPVGKPITICWTSDGGAGFWGGVLKVITISKDDTRTTMDLVKIGDFGGKSIFILLDVHSKSLEQTLKENDLILLSFDNDVTFERGYLDNDDLEFNTIAIPDMNAFMISTSFVGYCGWEDMQKAYDKAPDVPYYIPENAPSQYQFNYSNNKSEKINVSGSLLSADELDQINMEEIIPISSSGSTSESFQDFSNYKLVTENSKVLSFSEFSSSLVFEAEEKEDEKKEEDKIVSDKIVDQWIKEYTKDENIAKGQEIQTKNAESPYGQISMAVYKAIEIQFVDPASKGQSPAFRYFIVGDESLDVEKDEAINVEVTSDDAVNAPRYGLATYVPPAPPEGEEGEEEEEGDGQEEIKPIEPEDLEKNPEFVTSREDVDVKQKKNSLVIFDTDTETEEDVNILEEFVTEEDKKELGIKDWKNMTKMTVRYDRAKNPIKVILRNKFGGFDKVRRIKKGEAGFDTAVKIIDKVKSGIKYN
jgi:hypothetical protein